MIDDDGSSELCCGENLLASSDSHSTLAAYVSFKPYEMLLFIHIVFYIQSCRYSGK